MSLRTYQDVIFTVKAAVAYTPSHQPYKKLILTASVLQFSGINLNIMYIQIKGK